MGLKSNRVPYTQTMKAVGASCTAAKTTETDTTNAVLLYTAPANAPAFLTALTAVPNATVTATRCKVYIRYGGAGALRQVRNRLMSAVTVNETSQQNEVDFGWTDTNRLKLGPGDQVYVAIGVAQASGIEFTGAVEEYEQAA